jgi:two-component system response regulator (stage 0 sporulation protein A)
MTKKQIRVLIGDDGAEFGMTWARSLMAKGMYVITRQKNGKILFDTLQSNKFDVVVMEAKMPNWDAVSLINKIHSQFENPPIMVVIANFDSTQTEREIMEAGANYYMVKPFEASVLAAKIGRLVAEARGVFADLDNIEYAATDIIHQIEIPAHIKGYYYLRTAILLSAENPQLINNVTGLLYPAVAKQYQTTPLCVERAIRHAIKIAWEKGNSEAFNRLLGYSTHSAQGRPTNLMFIASIADKLRLKFKVSEKP